MIDNKDLVIGEVYIQNGDSDCQERFITRFSGLDIEGDTVLNIEGEDYFTGGFTDSGGDVITLRKATLEEIIWLEACEKADEFVSRKKALSKVKKLTKSQTKKIFNLIDQFDDI